MTDTDIPQRLSAVRDRAARAALAAGRNPADVRLIAVSKNFPVDSVRAAASAGQVDFGENRVQEGLEKIAAGPAGLEWHLIGHLQTNKARKAAAAFRWIHSIDSVDLLLKVDRAAADAGKTPSVLIQVDLAGEATKSGAKPEAVPAIVDAARGCASARLVGLMLMPPFFDDPED
ncbi:MAG: YggS family pyridoxal phosphate-dependent enzyme, partial [Bacteroidales bacterium]